MNKTSHKNQMKKRNRTFI